MLQMVETHWKKFVVLATVVGFIASLITIGQTIYKPIGPTLSPNATYIPVSLVTASKSTVDFALSWSSKDGVTYPSGVLLFCGSGVRTIQISVSPLTNNPRPVALSIMNPAAKPFYISNTLSFLPSRGTRPFPSELTIVFKQVTSSTPFYYNMTIVVDSGVVQTLTIPIQWMPSC